MNKAEDKMIKLRSVVIEVRKWDRHEDVNLLEEIGETVERCVILNDYCDIMEIAMKNNRLDFTCCDPFCEAMSFQMTNTQFGYESDIDAAFCHYSNQNALLYALIECYKAILTPNYCLSEEIWTASEQFYNDNSDKQVNQGVVEDYIYEDLKRQFQN